MKDVNGHPLRLSLLYGPSEGGRKCGRSLIIYCDYWIQNEANVPLLYAPPGGQAAAAGLELVDVAARSFPEMYKKTRSSAQIEKISRKGAIVDLSLAVLSRPFMYSNDKLCLRLSDVPSKWTDSLELSGRFTSGVTEIECDEIDAMERDERKEGEREKESERSVEEYFEKGDAEGIARASRGLFQFGVEVTSAPGSYWRSKLVIIKPHIHFVNLTGVTLLFTQSLGVTSSFSSSEYSPFPIVRVDPGERKPFHWAFRPPKNANRLIQMSLARGVTVGVGAKGKMNEVRDTFNFKVVKTPKILLALIDRSLFHIYIRTPPIGNGRGRPVFQSTKESQDLRSKYVVTVIYPLTSERSEKAREVTPTAYWITTIII